MTHSDFVDIRAIKNTDRDIAITVETIYQIARHAQSEIEKLLENGETRFSFDDVECWPDNALSTVFYSLLELFRIKEIQEPKYIQLTLEESKK